MADVIDIPALAPAVRGMEETMAWVQRSVGETVEPEHEAEAEAGCDGGCGRMRMGGSRR
jgi:hypothetical protein